MSFKNGNVSVKEWSSSDISVVLVENGIISAISVGEAVVTATGFKGEKSSCNVIVSVDNNSFSLRKFHDFYRIKSNYAYEFEPELYYNNVKTPCKFSYSLCDTTVGSINNNVFTPIKEGKTNIIVKAEYNGEKVCEKTAVITTIEDVILTLNKDEVELKLSALESDDVTEFNIVPTLEINAENVSDMQFTYLSTDPTIASVSSIGKIIPKKEGITSIKVSFLRNEKEFFRNIVVKVTKPIINTEKTLMTSLQSDDCKILLSDIGITTVDEVKDSAKTTNYSFTVSDGYVYLDKDEIGQYGLKAYFWVQTIIP